MSLKLPARNLEDWAVEIIGECTQSRETRRDLIKMYRSYYFTGTSEGTQAIYNRCYPHIETARRVPLFTDRCSLRHRIRRNRGRRGPDHGACRGAAPQPGLPPPGTSIPVLRLKGGTNCARVDGCAILKTVWGHDGLEGWLVKPTFFGVLREDIDDLDRQEAFVHTTYLTTSAFERTIVDHPERAEILAAGQGRVRPGRSGAG